MQKEIYGNTLREQLEASARDRMRPFVLCDGSVRGALIEGTKLVNEMRSNHRTGVLETLALGHAYIGTLLLSSNLKGRDKIILKIDCEGPIQGISVEANVYGEVRGYLGTPAIPVESPVESLDLAPWFGPGVLSVTKVLEEARRPFTGQIELTYGNLGEDLANFCLRSEQIPSSFSLSVYFDSSGAVTGAGGLMIQALPGADPEDIERIEEVVTSLPSIGESFSKNATIDTLITGAFAEFSPELLEDRRVEFTCHCSKNRFRRFLTHLSPVELKDMAENGPFPLILTCFNCNTSYSFDRDQIQAIYAKAISR